jgi:uncharacterized membrane protein (UPF0182 family)
MFRLPLYKAIYGLGFLILGLFSVFTIVFYFFITIQGETGGISGNVYRMNIRKSSSFMINIIENGGRKLAFFGLAVFLMIGAGLIIKNYDLVYSPRGVAFGASYTDVFVALPFNWFMFGLGIIGAIVVFYALRKAKIKLLVGVIGVMIGAFIIQGPMKPTVW